LWDCGNLDGDAGDVGLELHEETVRRPAAVDPEHIDRLTRPAHRFDEIACLVRDALERRASEMRARCPALDPDEQPPRVHIPVRSAEAGECRHEVYVLIACEPGR